MKSLILICVVSYALASPAERQAGLTCSSEEIHCMGDESQGMPDYCAPGRMPDKSGDLTCPGHCSPFCSPEESKCYGTTDPWTGCVNPDSCVLPDTDMYGGRCPSVCPVMCGPGEMECNPGTDTMGCRSQSYCQPASTPGINGTSCMANCPIMCDPATSYTCPGSVDSMGCTMPDSCHPYMMDTNGAHCPQTCEITCGANEMWCNNGMDTYGCATPSFCIQATTPGINGTSCMGHCPIQCDPNTSYKCPGQVDSMGCPMPESCYPIMLDSNGAQCPHICEQSCGANEMMCNEMMCNDGMDANGCATPSYCIPATTPGINGTSCMGHCPTQCDPMTSYKCPGPVDSMGCSMPETCNPFMHDSTGAQCASTCEPSCDMNEMKCNDGMDPTGCPTPSYCIQATTPGINGTTCMGYCPVQCDPMTSYKCPGPVDSMGCTMPEACMPFMFDSNGAQCPPTCEPSCMNANEMYCNDGMDDNGCATPSYCVPATIPGLDGQSCPGSCPLKCPPEQEVCHPVNTDPTLCPPGPVCVNAGETC
eukprot:TRINITY_DN1480_c0_g1_i6.p1 TRINITY_DN1480_c0_g1~~TRINITY_DN1480_c0_g1_i6.p1  ORF type:complete len:534 (-),score=36.32 TRINITY_DN1480_c0_g1_i6:88-1689(-)